MSSSENAISADALETPRSRFLQVVGYFIAFVVLGLTTASLGPTLQGLSDHLGATLQQMSILFTVRSLGYLMGSFFSGRVYDRFPSHPVLVGVLLVMGVSLALSPVMPLLVLMAIALMAVGVCEGFVDVGGNTLLVWVYRAHAGPFMNALHFFFGVGAFISPLIIALAVSISGDVAFAYWALAALVLPAALYLLLQPSPRPAIEEHAEDATRPPADRILVAAICIFFFLYVSGESSMGGWISSYVTALNPADKVTGNLLTSAFWGALTAGRLLSIPLAVRLKNSTLLFIDLIGALLSLLVILLFPGSQAALWTGAMGTGLFMAAIFPTMISFAGQRMATTGKITSYFLVGASLGGMTTPWLIGQLFEKVGPSIAFILIAAAVALALVLFALIQAYGKRET